MYGKSLATQRRFVFPAMSTSSLGLAQNQNQESKSSIVSAPIPQQQPQPQPLATEQAPPVANSVSALVPAPAAEIKIEEKKSKEIIMAEPIVTAPIPRINSDSPSGTDSSHLQQKSEKNNNNNNNNNSGNEQKTSKQISWWLILGLFLVIVALLAGVFWYFKKKRAKTVDQANRERLPSSEQDQERDQEHDDNNDDDEREILNDDPSHFEVNPPLEEKSCPLVGSDKELQLDPRLAESINESQSKKRNPAAAEDLTRCIAMLTQLSSQLKAIGEKVDSHDGALRYLLDRTNPPPPPPPSKPEIADEKEDISADDKENQMDLTHLMRQVDADDDDPKTCELQEDPNAPLGTKQEEEEVEEEVIIHGDK